MTQKEVNEEIISQAKGYIPFFSQALLAAASDHDEKKLRELGVTARKLYGDLSDYMNKCNPVDLSPDIAVLADYFRENAEEIEQALKREPTDSDEGEAWKSGG